ncbi:MAG: hypothetical protein ACPL28_04845 [bacterium]
MQHRILIPTSMDGLNFVRQNIIAVDSGDVPDAVIGPDSMVYLYFQGLWTHTNDGIMLGKSPDGFNDFLTRVYYGQAKLCSILPVVHHHFITGMPIPLMG